MEVRHGFAGIGPVVNDEPKPARQLEFLRHPPCSEQQMPQHGLVRSCCITHTGNHLLRNDQQVHRRLWGNIMNDNTPFVFVLDDGRNLTGNDALKKGFRHAGLSNAKTVDDTE